MQRYKGIPQAATDFKKYCSGREIKYTSIVCQKALQDLILVPNRAELEKKYGDKVFGCFTENDLEKFPTLRN